MPVGPSRRDVLVVAAVAVGVRLVVAALLARAPGGLSDPALYRGFARGIADGRGYVSLLGRPTSYYPPGYPMFLGALQFGVDRIGLRGSLPAAAAVVQAFLGGVGAAAVTVAGGRLAAVARLRPSPRSVGVACGLVLALWPNLVAYSAVLLSETLFVALFSVALAAVLVADRDVRWGWPLVVAAAAFGAATLVRPQVLLCLPAVALAWALARVPWRSVLLGAAVLAAGAVAFVVPWMVRNSVVLGSPVLSTNTGDNLCIGFRDGATGGFAIAAACDTGTRYVDGPEAEVARDEETQRRAFRWITAHPAELPSLSARKLWLTYRNDRDALAAAESYGETPRMGATTRRVVGAAFDVAWWTIVATAVTGAVVLARSSERRSVAVVVVVLTTVAGLAVPVLFFGDPRFKMGLAPSVALLAGVGACAAVAAWRERRGAPEAVAA
ncbi:MAG: hypothetical protein ACOYOP_04330 [Microthrixaceae bacterium]